MDPFPVPVVPVVPFQDPKNDLEDHMVITLPSFPMSKGQRLY